MKTKIISIINTLLLVDVGIVLFCYLQKESLWLINSQIGFFSSLLIVLASFYSYSQMIQRGTQNEIIAATNDETLEKIEDPHGLYDEEEEKKASVAQTTKKNSAYISLFRVAAYVVLVFGFFYLDRGKIFDMKSYFLGLTIPPILIAIMLFILLKKEKNETY